MNTNSFTTWATSSPAIPTAGPTGTNAAAGTGGEPGRASGAAGPGAEVVVQKLMLRSRANARLSQLHSGDSYQIDIR